MKRISVFYEKNIWNLNFFSRWYGKKEIDVTNEQSLKSCQKLAQYKRRKTTSTNSTTPKTKDHATGFKPMFLFITNVFINVCFAKGSLPLNRCFLVLKYTNVILEKKLQFANAALPEDKEVLVVKLKSSFRTLGGRHHEMVDRNGMFVSHIMTDICSN